MAHRAALTLLLSLLAPAAHAHEGDHSSMPHMVSLGLTPLHVAGFGDARNVGAIGVSLAYAYALGAFELRLRSEYLKPFPDDPVLRDGLHRFRGVLAPGVVASLVKQRLDLVAAFDVGAVVYRLVQEQENEHGVGWTASAGIELRGWVTWHTGFGLAVRGGYDEVRSGMDLRSAWPVSLTLGYSDRF